jgi:hypothetical protein
VRLKHLHGALMFLDHRAGRPPADGAVGDTDFFIVNLRLVQGIDAAAAHLLASRARSCSCAGGSSRSPKPGSGGRR